MTDEVTSWFRTSVLSSPTRQDIVSMITQLHPNAPLETMNKALSFNELLETSSQRGTANEDKRAAGTVKKCSKCKSQCFGYNLHHNSCNYRKNYFY